MGKKIVFTYDHAYPELWRDGLWAALEILKKDFEIAKFNLRTDTKCPTGDFYLGWGAFHSPVTEFMAHLEGKKGICIGGIPLPEAHDVYDVYFYETEWYGKYLPETFNKIHAFGVNTKIYKPKKTPKIYDCLTVGSYSLWKRQEFLTLRPGVKLAVGEIQKGNKRESYEIIYKLLEAGVGVMDMVEPEVLARIYNASSEVYIPAALNGGGERAILEARACGVPVTVEEDNEKLMELIGSELWDEKYYAKQLKDGICRVLEKNEF